MLERIPAAPFETFALGRYEARLHEALENGVIKQDQLQELTQEETVREYIQSQRQTLEQEFAVLMAVDEIFKREKLMIDEAEMNSLVDAQREEFRKAGKIATVRIPTLCICSHHQSQTRTQLQGTCWPCVCRLIRLRSTSRASCSSESQSSSCKAPRTLLLCHCLRRSKF